MRLGLILCAVMLMACTGPSRSDCDAMVRRNFKIFWGTEPKSADYDRELARCLKQPAELVKCQMTVNRLGDFGDCLWPEHRALRAKARAHLAGLGCDVSELDLLASRSDAGGQVPLKLLFGLEHAGVLDCTGDGGCRCFDTPCATALRERCQKAASDSQVASDAGPKSSTPDVTHE